MEIPAVLKEKGVVGAGGAGFPTYAKLKKEGIDYYLANGAECEPLLSVSKELVSSYGYQVLRGLWHLKNYTQAKHAVIAIKGKYKELLANLQQEIKKNAYDMEVLALADFFPAGDEQVLVFEATKRVVPEAGIPLFVGSVVNNTETLFNVYNAVDHNLPVTDKFITVGGEIPTPCTLKVPVGTEISWLLTRLGIDYNQKIILDGGPMMGKIINPQAPITKTTGGLLLFSPEHPVVNQKKLDFSYILRKAKTLCIQCRYCTDKCPRYLLGHDIQPHKIMNCVGYNLTDSYVKQALLCSECGVCETYACPHGLSPRRVNQELKKLLLEAKVKYTSLNNTYQAKEARSWRKIPMERLKIRLGIEKYDKYAYLRDEEFLPPRVLIPTKQHVGAPAVPLVEKGQKVAKGQILAAVPEEKLGCNIHASIAGIVREVSSSLIVIQREETP